MERLHAPNEFFRIRRLREGMRACAELWRTLADGPRVGSCGCPVSIRLRQVPRSDSSPHFDQAGSVGIANLGDELEVATWLAPTWAEVGAAGHA